MAFFYVSYGYLCDITGICQEYIMDITVILEISYNMDINVIYMEYVRNMSEIASDMSKIDFRIVIDSDVKDRFKEACKNLETPPSMSSEIEKFMNWFAACVEETKQKPKLSDISQGYHSDSHEIAIDKTDNASEKIFSILEDLKSNFESLDSRLNNLDNRLNKVEKNSSGPKNNPDYQPEVLGPGHKLNSSQLSKRLSDYKISLGGKAMGTGSLANNREKFKDNPQLHSEWIQPYDPHNLYWEYCEEEKVYIVSKIQQSLDL